MNSPSSSSLIQPTMPTYGQGLATSLAEQVNAIRGTGEFEGTGGLLNLVPLETELRRRTARADTDILRDTILGTEEMTGVRGVTQADVDSGLASAEQIGSFAAVERTPNLAEYSNDQTRRKVAFEELKEKVQSGDRSVATIEPLIIELGLDERTANIIGAKVYYDRWDDGYIDNVLSTSDKGKDLKRIVESTAMPEGEVTYTEKLQFTNPQTGEAYQEGDTVRTQDGLIDLLGDKRELQGMRTDYEQYVGQNGDIMEAFQRAKESGDPRTIEQFGRDHYESVGQAEGRELPETFGSLGRSAGFTEDGQFLGASAFAEDVGRGNVTRQRQQDLDDVSRFAGQYKDIMQQFRDPNTPKTIGEIGGGNDVFLNAMSGNAGATGEAGAEGTEGATAQPAGPGLRSMLASQATEALGQGLTERERQRIQDSFKAQSTMMGRTFDQNAGIREAEALVGESNQRKMQNRAFAQSVLGQEAGLRQAEISQAKASELDPFQAILGRSGGNPLQGAQGVLGQAGYGLQSGFNYLDPSAGLGYLQNNAANEMSAYNTAIGADATRDAGLIQGSASILSSLIPSFKIGK
tara:strand:+ start:363 stop:2093 length:1731 start_codon:yes stop_codon:yes gene_type:complete